MKTIRFKTLFFFLLSLLCAGCLKSVSSSYPVNDGPESMDTLVSEFVDHYQPVLLEGAGTLCPGNYFPFAPGYRWDYSGFYNETSTHVVGADTEFIKDEIPFSGYTGVYNPVQLSLSYGAVTAYPIDDALQMELRRYFSSENGEVRIRATQLTDEATVESKNSTYLKKELHAGDSWLTDPYVGESMIAKAVNGEYPDIQNIQVSMKTKSRSFVLGRIKIDVGLLSYPSLKVAQRSEFIVTAKGSGLESHYVIREDIKWDLAEDLGMIREETTIEIHETGKVGSKDVNLDETDVLWIGMDQFLLHGTPLEAAKRVAGKKTAGTPKSHSLFGRILMDG